MDNLDIHVETFKHFKKQFKLAWKQRDRGEKNKGYYVIFFHFVDPKIEPFVQIMRMPLFFRFLKRRKVIKSLYNIYNFSINHLYRDISENSSIDVSEYTFGLDCISLKIRMNLFKEFDFIW